MFRTAALTAARVARPAVASAVRAGVARPATAFVAAVPKVAAFQAVRFYSAGGSLNKDEVYLRIAQVLTGFDKVRLHFFERCNSKTRHAPHAPHAPHTARRRMHEEEVEVGG